MPDYCRLGRNSDHELECEGCRNIGSMLIQYYELRNNSQHAKQVALKTVLHNNFLELEQCAAKGCVTCRVFQRALWLRQITKHEADGLRIPEHQGKVWARIPSWPNEDANDASDRRVLRITIGNAVQQQQQVATIIFSMTQRLEPINLSSQFSRINVIGEARKWLKNCHEKHTQCGNLRWSNTNPSNLVEILDGAKYLKLVDTSDGPLLRYAAVSYTWGDGDGDAEKPGGKATIRAHRTTEDKLDTDGNIVSRGNLEQRRKFFPISSLPKTIRDVIQLTKNLGIRYIWIDAMCILPGADWCDEASKMHEVYGNACVTLALCSSEKTTDGLVQYRQAWQHHGYPCRLSMRYWLKNSDMPLDEVRIRSPLFNRAWTLQEERLSPRMLYLCGQRMYWSCSESQHAEVGANKLLQSPNPRYASFKLRRPQEFLATYHREDISGMHEQWLELVEAYSRRTLYDGRDRFHAIAGLAVRYADLFREHRQVKEQEYIAGLWRQTFTQELAWSMQAARGPQHNIWYVAPTWSWVSVPLGSEINAQTQIVPISEFKLLEEMNIGKANQSDDAFEVVKRGALIKSVKVSGPMRRLLSDKHIRKDWCTIAAKCGREDEYDFRSCIDESIFARDASTGRLVVYEPRRQPIIGQLDYLFSEHEEESNEWYQLSDAHLRDLYCLQIGESTMLLLCRVSMDDKEVVHQNREVVGAGVQRLWKYRRVGICSGVRSQFLVTAVSETMILV